LFKGRKRIFAEFPFASHAIPFPTVISLRMAWHPQAFTSLTLAWKMDGLSCKFSQSRHVQLPLKLVFAVAISKFDGVATPALRFIVTLCNTHDRHLR
jgi:hypothetical protein